MASRRIQRQYAFGLSVLAHAAIVAMLTFSVSLSGRQEPPAGNIVPVNSVLIDSSALDAEIARIEAEEAAAAAEAERVRQQEAEEARQREEARQERIQQEQEEIARIQREQEVAEQAAREEAIRIQQEAEEAERLAEQRRLAEERQREAERLAEEKRREEERLAELARQEEERRQQEEAARLAAERAERDRVESEIQAAIEAERAERAARDSGLRDQWARAIAEKVRLNWIQPPNAGLGLECVLVVTQLPNGEVINVVVDSCNRNDANIVRSIENAVLNASPLPGPPRGVPFERTLRIRFSPTE